MMNDILLNSALTYKNLLNIKYHVTIARKQKLVRLVISFPVEGYHHLAGFQYAGINQLKNRKEALEMILTQTVTEMHLCSAGTYDLISDRLTAIVSIPDLLEKGRLIFHYRGHEQKWSDIKADYLASIAVGASYIFFFTAENDAKEQIPVSIFMRSDTNYMKYCPSYKVLRVEKESLCDGRREIVYNSPSYREV